MRPDIYSRTLENIKAVLLFYFPNETHGSINNFADKVYDERIIALNQLEWLCEVIDKNKELFRRLYPRRDNMASTISMAFTAVFKQESEWNFSQNGLNILRELKEHLTLKERTLDATKNQVNP
jgi:hypothetical protein